MESINELASVQNELGKTIDKCFVNIKKDPTSRKTEEYFKNRLSSLEKYWNEFVENHTNMLQMDVPQHNYFKTNYYEHVKAIYEETKLYIQGYKPKKQEDPGTTLQLPKKSPSPDHDDSEQSTRMKRQQVKINKLEKEIKRPEGNSKEELQFAKETISEQWRAVQQLHEDIWVYEENFEDSYFTGNQFEKMEKIVYEKMKQIQQKINGTMTSSKVQLPQVTIPIFEGGYDAWTTFHDIFQKVVHDNNNLSDCEKMQYLKTHIKNEPSRIIQHLHISEANYETAWDLLNKRYQNKRLLLSKFLNKMFELPNIQQPNANNIKNLHDTINECLEGIKNIGMETSSWGPIISHMITKKWDSQTNQLYEQSLKSPNDIQSFQDIMSFITTRFQSLESILTKRQDKPTQIQQNFQCKYCKQEHPIHTCQKFKSLPVNHRIQFVGEKKMCYNCLGHDYNERCYSKKRCFICNNSHHTLLHKDRSTKQHPSQKSHPNVRKQEFTNHVGRQNKDVLLATALIKIKALNGNYELVRALVDPGSQATFITEEAAQLLGLPRQKITASISGLGEDRPKISKTKIQVEIKSHFPSDFHLTTEALILSKLTRSLPNQHLTYTDQESWGNRFLADPTFSRPGPIDVILGTEEYSKILLNGIHRSEDGLLGQNTQLGWILSGAIKEKQVSSNKVLSMVTCTDKEDLSRFWELEEEPKQQNLSEEDRHCEEMYQKTHERNKKGRYTVRLPLKDEIVTLGISRPKAVARFLQLEKKLRKDVNLAKQYKDFMQEYLKQGHMEKIKRKQMHKGLYYIPHQPVIKEDSTTTKLRVVFDASSQTQSGVSLNSVMYKGPRLQQELIDILLRWRKHKIAITADIEKMYRQIWVHEEDQHYQRIIWRFNNTDPLDEYKLTTVTYGTTAAPYLAIKTLQQLAEDEASTHPIASQLIKTDFYVDDLMSGGNSLEETKQLKHQLIQLLKSGGFNLRKWSSNSEELLSSIPKELCDQTSIEISEEKIRKTLGICWNPTTDKFKFKVDILNHTTVTKRNILSDVAKIFDPLGWLSPIIIKVKLIIQEMWKLQLDWDDQIPTPLSYQWEKFRSQLSQVEEIEVPRWVNYNGPQCQAELHGFCDASEKAYGAAIYIRTTFTTGIQVQLLIAKSKVAPIKTKKSLPRLELCAAVLLSKLLIRTKEAICIENMPYYAWTDSMIALAWLKACPSKWKNFVANRVAEIQQHTSPEHWHHVRSEENPADIITRGSDPSVLKLNRLWWNGPSWLHNPNLEITTNEATTTQELKTYHVSIKEEEPPLFNNCSSLTKAMRVTAYVIRYIRNSQKEGRTGLISTTELNKALKTMVKIQQHQHFLEERKNISKNQQLPRSSKLISLNPFIDEDGIIRVGGRLQHSSVPYAEKHPIILPYDSYLTTLIIRNAHLQLLHGGKLITMAYIRRKYWIINGKRAVNKVINACVTCVRYKAQTSQQLMGNLPAARVSQSQPFSHVGVDYAGPLQFRTSKGRGHKSYKGYIVVFICFSTKAIHLEAVTDMTSETFLAALRRFISRRGICSHIYSDNGTTFIGANKILRQEVKSIIKSEEIQDTTTNLGIQWHFIPPAAPHVGGLWEAGVKSVKHHLKRVVGEATLTFEEITTLLCQIEACLNSRPLCQLSSDVNLLEALTPGHFLIGKALLSPYNPLSSPLETGLTNKWKVIQKMKKDFWNAWSKEYLQGLQQRYKWQHLNKNIKVGDIVLIKEDNINPGRWPLAKVLETHPAEDGTVRVITVKTAESKSLKRPITKIVQLPIENEEETNNENTHTTANCALMKEKPVKKTSRKSTTSTTSSIFLTALLIFVMNTTLSSASYVIKNPDPGLYIEHLGSSHIERGTFRIDVKIPKEKINEDINEVTTVWTKMKSFCNSAKELSSIIQCDTLTEHLSNLKNQIDEFEEGINGIIAGRQRRGLLGKFLTSIFGVNDEVYEDINHLDKNQQELIRASTHQTKFMISALAQLNATETRMTNQLERYRIKLNQGLDEIEKMDKWFNAIDKNKLSIHVLNNYQLAENYIQEAVNRFKNLLEIHVDKAHFYDFISIPEARKLIAASNKKLPSNIKILVHPIITTKVEHTTKDIHIYGYYPMVEIEKFDVIKATPIPLQIQHGHYWIFSISEDLLAVNYNKQQYYEITEEEFKRSITLEPHLYLTSPAVVKNIENNPNCIVNELFQIHEDNKCIIQQYNISSIIWKQLFMSNTWVFMVPSFTKIAVTCSGVREDPVLNGTGIIQITQDCTIKTKQNLISAKRNDNVPVMSGLSKPINFTLHKLEATKHHLPVLLKEPVLKTYENLQSLKKQQEEIENELEDTTWQSIHHQSIVTNVIVMLGLIIVVVAAWVIWKMVRRWFPCKTTSPPVHPPNQEFQLEPLYSLPGQQNGARNCPPQPTPRGTSGNSETAEC